MKTKEYKAKIKQAVKEVLTNPNIEQCASYNEIISKITTEEINEKNAVLKKIVDSMGGTPSESTFYRALTEMSTDGMIAKDTSSKYAYYEPASLSARQNPITLLGKNIKIVKSNYQDLILLIMKPEYSAAIAQLILDATADKIVSFDKRKVYAVAINETVWCFNLCTNTAFFESQIEQVLSCFDVTDVDRENKKKAEQ